MSSESESTLPPQVALYRMAVGHYVSRALALAADVGLADHLADGPRSADDLATATETHADALRRVLRLLVSVGSSPRTSRVGSR
jgi:hypothetical protein